MRPTAKWKNNSIQSNSEQHMHVRIELEFCGKVLVRSNFGLTGMIN